MNTALLLITSLLAILIALLSEQLPRFFQHHAAAPTRPITDGTNIPKPSASRRPWDPPFPQRAPTKTKWLVLPPSTLRRTGSEHSEGTRGDGCDETIEESHEEPRSSTSLAAECANGKQERKEARPITPVLWTILAILIGILLVLAFAILIAHCLAWFIVYKTEARLGEARRGLIQAGEMRLCLCARG